MLALPNGLEMVDTFSSPDARQNGPLFVLPVLRDDNCDGPANGLFGGVAKDTLRASVPTRDNAVEVLADDRIVTGLDNRCQPTQLLFAFAKCRFGILALGNVNPRGMQERYRPRLVANGIHRKVHDALAAVGNPVAKLFAEYETRSGLIGREAYPRLHLFRSAPPRGVTEWPVQNLLSRVSARLHGQVVDFQHVALQVQNTLENAGLVEKGFKFGGRSAQFLQQGCLPGVESLDLRNVAIDLEHGVIAEQLHPAV